MNQTMNSLNGNRTVHAMHHTAARRHAEGRVDTSRIATSAAGAREVLDAYAIYAKGSKVNGHGETVEVYHLFKPGAAKPREVQARFNGVLSCNCPGWTRHADRVCRHTLAIKALRAGQ